MLAPHGWLPMQHPAKLRVLYATLATRWNADVYRFVFPGARALYRNRYPQFVVGRGRESGNNSDMAERTEPFPDGGVLTPRRVAVLGAGIVGVSCALHLQRDGHSVTLVDRGEPGRGTSFGNAGIIVDGGFMPVGMPGMWRDVPKFLLGTEPYFSLRWPHLPRLAPWLLRLLRETRRSRVEANAAALAILAREAKPAWRDLIRRTDTQQFVIQKGWLKVYETEAAFDATANVRALYDRHGGVYEVLGADEIRQMEPTLAPIFNRAFYFPEIDSLSNPLRMIQAFVADFIARGGRVLQGEVTGFRPGLPATERAHNWCRDRDGCDCAGHWRMVSGTGAAVGWRRAARNRARLPFHAAIHGTRTLAPSAVWRLWVCYQSHGRGVTARARC